MPDPLGENMRFADKLNRNLLKHFPPSVTGRDLSYSDISKRLNRAMKPLGLSVRVVKSQAIADNEKARPLFDVTGSAEDEKIFINVLVSPVRSSYQFTKARYKKLLFLVSMTAQHELIHYDQRNKYPKAFYRRIEIGDIGRIREERVLEMDYYREWREVDAYAHDIAMEMEYFYPTLDKYKILRHIDRYKKLSHFKRYVTTFRGVEWKEVRKLLIRKVIRWIPSAKVPDF